MEHSDLATQYKNSAAELKEQMIQLMDTEENIICGKRVSVSKRISKRKTLNQEKLKGIITPEQYQECIDTKVIESYTVLRI